MPGPLFSEQRYIIGRMFPLGQLPFERPSSLSSHKMKFMGLAAACIFLFTLQFFSPATAAPTLKETLTNAGGFVVNIATFVEKILFQACNFYMALEQTTI